MSNYPESDKIALNEARYRTVNDFIDWLGARGIRLVRLVRDTNVWEEVRVYEDNLVTDYLGIDREALEKEREDIMERIRARHEGERDD